MKMKFTNENFKGGTLDIVKQADSLIREYSDQGLPLSLRQLFYQFVSRGWLANKQENYNKLGNIVSRARMSGDLDWAGIEDRGRSVQKNNWWSDPSEILEAVAQQFHLDLWEDQLNYVICMVEKEALEGIMMAVCLEEDVRCTANKGYASATHLFQIGRDFNRKYFEEGRECHVLYLGDHDPSGIDMTRDIRERLELFSGVTVNVQRLALNMDQVEQYEPPPNPAKTTDSRFGGYFDRYGDESWELDALNPTVLADLIRSAILNLREDDKYQAQLVRQDAMRLDLQRMADNYTYEGE